MADHAALVRAFGEYARTISRDYDIGEVLYRLTDQAVEVLGVDGAGVSLADEDKRLRFVTASDERVAAVEERQADLAMGPCHDAFEHGGRVAVTDLAGDDRWPDYRATALEQGFTAVAGVPMSATGQRIGALNLYRGSPGPWRDDDLEIAQVLADMTTGYVINARTLSSQRELTTQLQHALDSRIVIEQAKGVLAERHGTDTAAAFQLVRRHARATNRRVHDVAGEVMSGRLDL